MTSIIPSGRLATLTGGERSGASLESYALVHHSRLQYADDIATVLPADRAGRSTNLSGTVSWKIFRRSTAVKQGEIMLAITLG